MTGFVERVLDKIYFSEYLLKALGPTLLVIVLLQYQNYFEGSARNAIVIHSLYALIPRVLLTQSRDCQCCALSSSALLLTQSLPNKREAFVWLF
jgi:hypothetical protein